MHTNRQNRKRLFTALSKGNKFGHDGREVVGNYCEMNDEHFIIVHTKDYQCSTWQPNKPFLKIAGRERLYSFVKVDPKTIKPFEGND